MNIAYHAICQHFCRYFLPLQKFVDRFLCGSLCIRFFTHARCGASRNYPPVIEYAGNMHNLLGRQFTYDSRRQIIVLRTFKTNAETLYLTYKRCSVDPQVTNHILSQKEVRIPFRFKIGSQTYSLFVNSVFIRVKDSCIWVPLQGLHNPKKGIWSE